MVVIPLFNVKLALRGINVFTFAVCWHLKSETADVDSDIDNQPQSNSTLWICEDKIV